MRARLVLCVLVALLASGLGWEVAAERVVAASISIAAAPRIPAGFLQMGSDAADVEFALALCSAHAPSDEASLCRSDLFADEQPRHRVYLGSFRLDRTEVSQRAYARCVEQGACAPARVSDLDARLGQLEQPVVGVTVVDAGRYCAWTGGRLPTEAEWERAARGDTTRRFPWGNFWNDRVANHGTSPERGRQRDGYEFAAPVSAYADGKSAFGLRNLAGNVWELTADRYAADAYAKSERIDPQGPVAGDQQVIRGGSWRSAPHTLRVTQRAAIKRDESRPDVGFRCAYNVP